MRFRTIAWSAGLAAIAGFELVRGLGLPGAIPAWSVGPLGLIEGGIGRLLQFPDAGFGLEGVGRMLLGASILAIKVVWRLAAAETLPWLTLGMVASGLLLAVWMRGRSAQSERWSSSASLDSPASSSSRKR